MKKKAFAHLSEHLELAGFRKGHIPEDIAKNNIAETLLLNEMAEKVLQEIYPTIIKEKRLDVIGRPELSITKLARNNPLGFTITATILTAIELPDYKKIASGVDSSTPEIVTEEMVDKVLGSCNNFVLMDTYTMQAKTTAMKNPYQK